MPELARPVLLSIVENGDSPFGKHIQNEFASYFPGLRVLCLDVRDGGRSANEVASFGSELREELQRLLEQVGMIDPAPGTWPHWISVLSLSTAEQSAVTLEVIRDVILDAAMSLHSEGHDFSLTLLFVDDSTTRTSAAKSLLSELFQWLDDPDLALNIQVYLIRRRLGGQGLLTADDLLSAATLACRSLVLTNAVDSARLSEEIRHADTLIVGVEGGTDRIFGRMALLNIRSLERDRAERYAFEELATFSQNAGKSSAPVRTGWQPELIAIATPEVTTDPGLRIGAGFRDGPPNPLTGPPSVWLDPHQELRRIENETQQWLDGLEGWRRRVRLEFGASVREFRESALNERRRVQEAIHDQLTRFWTDRSMEAPIPYTHQWLSRQHGSWVDDRQAFAAQARNIRSDQAEQLASSLDRPLQQLRHELARRPNTWLMAFFTACLLAGGIALLWELLGNIVALAGETPWLGDSMADSLQGLRLLITLVFAGTVLAVVGVTLFRMKLRWDRAYSDVERVVNAIASREGAAIQQEFRLVNGHWYLNTLSASIRQLGHATRRLGELTRQLAISPRVEKSSTESAIIRYVPSPTEFPDMFSSHQVSKEMIEETLRSDSLAGLWIEGRVDLWRSTALNRLRQLFADAWQQYADEEIDSLLRRELQRWHNIAPRQLARRPAAANEHTLYFATGRIGNHFALLSEDERNGEFVQFNSEFDEILCCRVQMGLTPDLVSR